MRSQILTAAGAAGLDEYAHFQCPLVGLRAESTGVRGNLKHTTSSQIGRSITGSIGTTVDRSVTFQNVTGSISTTSDISFVGIASDSLGEYSILNEDCKGNALTGGSTRNS